VIAQIVLVDGMNLGQRVVRDAVWQVVEVDPPGVRNLAVRVKEISQCTGVHEGVTQHLNDRPVHIEPSGVDVPIQESDHPRSLLTDIPSMTNGQGVDLAERGHQVAVVNVPQVCRGHQGSRSGGTAQDGLDWTSRCSCGLPGSTRASPRWRSNRMRLAKASGSRTTAANGLGSRSG
jgi:hypothetical protein